MNISKYEVAQIGGGAAVGFALGKFAHSHNKHTVVVIGYALSGLAIGAGITDTIMMKTKIKPNDGWAGLGDVIMIGAGAGLLGVSYIVSRFLKK